jgi:hypothetical protein
MRVSVVATGIDAEAQGQLGAERDTAVAKLAAPVPALVAGPVVGKGSAPEPASAAFPNPADPAKLPGRSAGQPAAKLVAGPVGSDPGKVKLRFDPDARPSAGRLFPSRAARRPEPVSVRAANGDALPDRRPSLAAPDPAERILPNGPDRKPPPVSRLPRH